MIDIIELQGQNYLLSTTDMRLIHLHTGDMIIDEKYDLTVLHKLHDIQKGKWVIMVEITQDRRI